VRVVGLDVGERRIGVAISDATRTLARPLTVLQIAQLDAGAVARAAEEISRLAAEEDGVSAIVVGLPSRLDGRPTGLTAEAESRLAEHDKDWRSRKKRLDAAAAAIILQDHLDGLPR
jgi:putative Holliday junction resolvase